MGVSIPDSRLVWLSSAGFGCGSATPAPEHISKSAVTESVGDSPSNSRSDTTTASARPADGDASPTAKGSRVGPNVTVTRPSESPTDGVNMGSKRETHDDVALFRDMMDNHWSRIFPNGGRNAGGPQFFKYIYERPATSHDLFKRYSRFYCGVSGSIVKPGGERYDVVKIKDAKGQCIVGKYHRCCWPCSAIL